MSFHLHRSMVWRAASLLLCVGLASCSSAPSPQPLSRSMPDGKRWTAANLNVEIPGSYCFDDQSAKCQRYGRLYTWAAAHEVCSSLGSGWRLPSMGDWKTLARNYDGPYGDGPGNGKVAYQAFGKGSAAVFDQNGGEKTSAYSVRCVSGEQHARKP